VAEQDKTLLINKEFNLAIVITILKRHWISPVFYIFIFSLFAFVYLRYTKPIYKATSVLQIIDEDRVGAVLGENTIENNTDLSKEIELLRSEVLFNRAISNLQLQTSIFSEGKVVTRDLYRSAPFEIIVYRFSDSTMCNKRIDLSLNSKNDLILKYQKNGKNKVIVSSIKKHIVKRHFDIVCRVINKNVFYKLINLNHIYFTFNNSTSLQNELHQSLVVNPIDENAKTIEISFTNYNPRLCYDVVNSVLNVYLNYEKNSKQTKATKTIAFINQQLDSLSKVLKISKDSLNSFQRIEKIPDIDKMGETLSENIDELTKQIGRASCRERV